jgi:hypothetical protein
MAGLKSECMADITSEQLADFVGIRTYSPGVIALAMTVTARIFNATIGTTMANTMPMRLQA